MNLGDASLEFLRFPRLARLMRFAPSVGGLAFTVASLDAAIARLRDLGFSARRTPRGHRESAEGYDAVTWVGAFVRGWPGAVVPFLCEYSHNPAERRPQLLTRLHDAGGGRLGVVGLRGVTVAGLAASGVHSWERLLDMAPTDGPHQWRFATGVPRLEVTRHATSSLTLLLAVDSTDDVSHVATHAGFATRVDGPRLQLRHPHLPNLALILTPA